MSDIYKTVYSKVIFQAIRDLVGSQPQEKQDDNQHWRPVTARMLPAPAFKDAHDSPPSNDEDDDPASITTMTALNDYARHSQTRE